MFIGGLNWETTDESLKEYFTQFGDVLECTVMRDGPTGRSRGFGFLTFKDPQTVNVVMDQEHFLDGKIIDPKRAIPRDEQEKTSKIFVGGISQECTESDFKEYFQQFGRVLDSTLMIDKDTGRPRGFGFVTFDNEQAVENALNHPDLQIHGKAIEVKKAQPRGNMRGQHFEEDSSKFRQARLQAEQAQQQNQMQMPAFPTAGGYSMSPAMMATYWQKMQQYMMAMQRTGVPPMAMMPGMTPNPMMAAQMQMQMAAMAGAGRGMQPGMPQAPPPMPQGPPPFGATDFGGMGRGNQQQQFYEANHQRIPPHQRDFQHQQQAQNGPAGAQGNWQGGEGMYDGGMQQGQSPAAQGIASPNQQPAQPAATGQTQGAPSQPQNQRQSLTPGPRPGEGPPPNAPTGPRNNRGPATNFRGAGRGIGMAGRAGFAGRGNMGGHVGYHPYARNG
ncbi:RNA-binding domain-containing protein [Ascobolus immersus RN42]|uniref:RNA-binding domain-containing protein n=1 Tax=Ascobolus immersus RN42 TaxID=1160509 RepID=A0A3N4I8I5_ASCIM|nr:RNA-binding domain-containing protein [Ascobolus immersus RN42]